MIKAAATGDPRASWNMRSFRKSFCEIEAAKRAQERSTIAARGRVPPKDPPADRGTDR